jgi:hypothetical protein
MDGTPLDEFIFPRILRFADDFRVPKSDIASMQVGPDNPTSESSG